VHRCDEWGRSAASVRLPLEEAVRILHRVRRQGSRFGATYRLPGGRMVHVPDLPGTLCVRLLTVHSWRSRSSTRSGPPRPRAMRHG